MSAAAWVGMDVDDKYRPAEFIKGETGECQERPYLKAEHLNVCLKKRKEKHIHLKNILGQ